MVSHHLDRIDDFLEYNKKLGNEGADFVSALQNVKLRLKEGLDQLGTDTASDVEEGAE